ncbi:hypothetical protein P4H42_31035, partial [Paenibacillus macerans]|uniref:hypothetical protein n=1 Tax=Paenibacillus macerans TaxID=44252 RepID=UPI002DB9D1C5
LNTRDGCERRYLPESKAKITGFQRNKHHGNRYNLKSMVLEQIALVATVRALVCSENVSCQT